MARMFSVRNFPVSVRRKNSETENVFLGESPDNKLFSIFYEIHIQELSWRGLLTMITPSGMRAGSPPGLSLISRGSEILRELLSLLHWSVKDSL